MIVLCIVFLLSGVSADILDGWHGIRVFESDRESVEKAFGKPIRSDGPESFYEVDRHWIRVLSAEGECSCPDRVVGGYKVKKGVVIGYTVNFRPEISLSELNIDKAKFLITRETHRTGFTTYEDSEVGIRLTTNLIAPGNEVVEKLTYYPSLEKERKFRCQSG